MAAKLKPLSKAEDIAKIPVTEPVLVEIAPAPSGLEPEPKKDAQTPEPKIESQEPETDAGKLKKEYDKLKQADQQRNEALQRAQRERDDAIRAQRESEREREEARNERERAYLDNVNSGLAGAQAEQSAAEQEYANAFAASDGVAMAKAQGKIARAAAKVLNYEGAAAELADRAEQAKRQPVSPQRAPEPQDITVAVQNNPQLLPKEKEWLLAHQELLLDQAEGKLLEAAYIKATRQGHRRGTDAYFQFLDKELGYAQSDPEPRNDNQSEPMIMAAPVSRDNVSPSGNNQSSDRVVLTPDEREMAKSLGISDIAYAQNKLRLQQEKKQNPERFYSPTGR